MKGKFENRLAKCKSFNEFYTLPESCEEIFRPIRPFLMDKKIHCPCDDENSAIVKWLKQNTNSTITFSHLPEHDMNGDYARQKMLDVDLVVTNPPYSLKLWTEFFTWLNTNNVDYFIFGPIIRRSNLLKLLKNTYDCPTHRAMEWDYLLSTGEIKNATTIFYTSLNVASRDYVYKQPKKEISYFNNIPVYDRTKNVPKDYYDWMYVPCTFIYFITLANFEFDIDAQYPPYKFVRFKVRRLRPDG